MKESSSISKNVSLHTNKVFFTKESEHPYGLEFSISTSMGFKKFAQKSIKYYTAFKFAESDKGKLKTNGFLFDSGYRCLYLTSELLENKKQAPYGKEPLKNLKTADYLGIVVKFKKEQSIDQFIYHLKYFLKKHLLPLDEQYEKERLWREQEDEKHRVKIEKAKSSGFEIR
ncbi:hypothetical protein ACPCXE_06360 [Bacillus velezensis]|uniref:hypothetical protein n=1 Tax=Bacillus velezensis TaxID=492670 RepID=UPI0013D01289|nr:hypothetical protein [Bacillus velezensis]MEC2277224.1 hypothetical protein [Bacillus velezensis]MEC2312052.1 hypothetical protein [Bacillus velezensis]MED3700906.1 hypothetical protein [Bacillus velezensis]